MIHYVPWHYQHVHFLPRAEVHSTVGYGSFGVLPGFLISGTSFSSMDAWMMNHESCFTLPLSLFDLVVVWHIRVGIERVLSYHAINYSSQSSITVL